MKAITALATPLLLAATVLVGMTLGSLAPHGEVSSLVLWPAVALQTAMSVGALPPGWLRSRVDRGNALRLYAIHTVVATVPSVLIFFLLPSEARTTPLVVGLLALAIVPSAAGLPAFAVASRASPQAVTGYAVTSYVFGLGITPALGLLVFGTDGRVLEIMLAIGVGLILPAVLAITLSRYIRRIPVRVRTVVLMITMLATTFVFGGSLASSLQGSVSDSAATLVLLLLVGAGAARVLVTALISLLFTLRRPELRRAAMLSTSFKNDALAASVALSAGGPAAVLPAVGSLVAEIVLMVAVSVLGHLRRSSTPDESSESQAGQSAEVPSTAPAAVDRGALRQLSARQTRRRPRASRP